jgi:hypothetical protein
MTDEQNLAVRQDRYTRRTEAAYSAGYMPRSQQVVVGTRSIQQPPIVEEVSFTEDAWVDVLVQALPPQLEHHCVVVNSEVLKIDRGPGRQPDLSSRVRSI